MSSLTRIIERFYDLNVGLVGTGEHQHERPHKPVLLLAVIDLIAQGKIEPNRVLWSEEMRERFGLYFEKVRRLNDKSTPENPFLYLKGDGFWTPFTVVNGTDSPLEHPPTVADAAAGRVFAVLSPEFESVLRNPRNRLKLREALASRYFPNNRQMLEPLFAEQGEDGIDGVLDSEANSPDTDVGRNPAFRRKVLEVYDSQCVACGLRINLPSRELTFVDGAHLIPYATSQNDHPSNGIALCKNHHWAMDRFLIVPTRDRRWACSPRLDARRSRGEEELSQLNGRALLAPHDEAFRPAIEGLIWRSERLWQG